MKVVVWSNQDFFKDIKLKKIWVGDLPCIPRAGDLIEISQDEDDVCVETVLRVEWLLKRNEAHLCVGPDYQNVYENIEEG